MSVDCKVLLVFDSLTKRNEGWPYTALRATLDPADSPQIKSRYLFRRCNICIAPPAILRY